MGSFLSEHTAEFVLVPRAVTAFSTYSTAVVPIYLWANREGGRAARACAPDTRIRIVSIFARRPKTIDSCDDRILVKLNRELFHYSKEASSRGVPTLAGIPLVASLHQLRLECECAWWRLTDHPYDDLEFVLPLECSISAHADGDHYNCPRQLHTLAKEAVSEAKLFCWDNALETLRELRRACAGHHYRYGSRYKPFSLLLFE